MPGLSEFLAMGGYGAYVWPALGITAAVMAGLWIASARRLKAQEKALEALGQRGRDGPQT